jgi:hypothetical protein
MTANGSDVRWRLTLFPLFRSSLSDQYPWLAHRLRLHGIRFEPPGHAFLSFDPQTLHKLADSSRHEHEKQFPSVAHTCNSL